MADLWNSTSISKIRINRDAPAYSRVTSAALPSTTLAVILNRSRVATGSDVFSLGTLKLELLKATRSDEDEAIRIMGALAQFASVEERVAPATDRSPVDGSPATVGGSRSMGDTPHVTRFTAESRLRREARSECELAFDTISSQAHHLSLEERKQLLERLQASLLGTGDAPSSAREMHLDSPKMRHVSPSRLTSLHAPPTTPKVFRPSPVTGREEMRANLDRVLVIAGKEYSFNILDNSFYPAKMLQIEHAKSRAEIKKSTGAYAKEFIDILNKPRPGRTDVEAIISFIDSHQGLHGNSYLKKNIDAMINAVLADSEFSSSSFRGALRANSVPSGNRLEQFKFALNTNPDKAFEILKGLDFFKPAKAAKDKESTFDSDFHKNLFNYQAANDDNFWLLDSANNIAKGGTDFKTWVKETIIGADDGFKEKHSQVLKSFLFYFCQDSEVLSGRFKCEADFMEWISEAGHEEERLDEVLGALLHDDFGTTTIGDDKVGLGKALEMFYVNTRKTTISIKAHLAEHNELLGEFAETFLTRLSEVQHELKPETRRIIQHEFVKLLHEITHETSDHLRHFVSKLARLSEPLAAELRGVLDVRVVSSSYEARSQALTSVLGSGMPDGEGYDA